MLVAPAHAQTADTLDRVLKTHVVNIGVRDVTPPFSTIDKATGKANGYSVDLCHKLVEFMRKEIKVADLHVQEVPITSANRLEKVKDGSIDLECGSTGITKARLKEVDFSFPVLFAAQRLLVDTKAGISSQTDLAGKTVAVVKGSMGERIINTLKASEVPTMKIEQYASNDDAVAALDAGKVQAFSQMDIILESVRLKSKNPAHLVLAPWPMTVEPIGFPMRKNDPRFRTAVNNAIKAMFAQNDFRVIYDHWFNGQVKIPLSGLMMENLQRPSAEPGFSLVMGVDL